MQFTAVNNKGYTEGVTLLTVTLPGKLAAVAPVQLVDQLAVGLQARAAEQAERNIQRVRGAASGILRIRVGAGEKI